MKSKLRISRLVLFLTVIMASVISLSAAIFNELKASYSINSNDAYTATLPTGEKLRCYKIKDTLDPLAKKAAISWLWKEDGTNPVPANLDIPEEVTLNDGDYKVVSVYKGGFRNCTFTSITLPKTVEEINEEAFAYCMNLTSFSIPYKVSRIAASTFMDCKNLGVFYYTDLEDPEDETSNVIKKLGNDKIVEIADHAFDNCINLKGLYFPTSLVTIGNSAFQRCKSLQSLFLPSANANNTNKVRVGSYAFADCPLLKTVYFEENVEYFGEYCFVNDKEDLTYTYTGSSEPTSFDAHWRDKNITTSNDNKYPFITNQAKVTIDKDYPGLIFSFEKGPQYLDCAGPTPSSDVIKVIEASEDEYVKINGFQEPFTTQPGYYDVDLKIITIPNTIQGKPVKSIGQNAFAGQPFTGVIFNENLVQIQNRAFYGCSNIATLNFSACTNLREISYEIFQSTCPDLFSELEPKNFKDDQVYNNTLHSISLPNCLEFIGDSAFYNFVALTGGITFKGTDPNAPSNLKVIGDFAFSVFRSKTVTYTANQLIDVELPNSLDDRWATGYNKNGTVIPAVKFYHPYNPWGGKNRKRRCAIGRFAFENQDIIGTLKMEKATAEQKADMDYTTSFMSNGVARCNNLYRFETNDNLYLVGSDMFKLCPSIKEIFFHTEKAQYQHDNNNGAHFPWGIRDDAAFPGNNSSAQYENGIFSGTGDEDGNKGERPEAVVYISGPQAPGWMDDLSKYRNGSFIWNVDDSPTLRTDMDVGSNNTTRGQISNKKKIPTFYNAVWEGEDINIHYWKPGSDGGTFRPLTTTPYTLSVAEYNSGYISLYPTDPTSATSNYTVVRYYSDGASGHYSEEIDLTNISTSRPGINGHIDQIASSAFATAVNKKIGLYFILPDTITKIGERAFFRKGGANSNSIRIVTTKVGGVIQVPNGESRTYAQIKSSYSTDTGGYCILPSGVTTIEADCFFNNNFKTIVISRNVTKIEAGAFTVKAYNNKVTSIQYDHQEGDPFEFINSGLYYVKTEAKKTLVYQTGGTSTDTLYIEEGTKAVGFRAAVNINYQEVVIPEGLTTIYGQAFFGSKLTKLSGSLSSIKYISARTLSGDTEVYDKYDGTYPFDNYDITPVKGYAATHDTYINGGRASAFRSCSNLTDVDFTQFTSLKVIGTEAFRDCSNLKNVSPNSYTFYNYVGKNSGQTAQVITDKVVLDLSGCSELRKIQASAFTNVNSINYTILPDTVNGSTTVESQMVIENDANAIPPKSEHLVGESYHQAGINFYDSNLNPRNHYGKNALGTTKNYWRFFVGTDLPVGASIEDYLAKSAGSSQYQDEKYWTLYNGNYYLFKGYDQPKAFFNAVANGTYLTPGQALSY